MNTNIDRTMYTFTYTNKAKPETVETFLRNLKFSYLNGQTINIVLDANETNIPNNAAMTNGTGKLAGHYYMYVPDNTKIPWTTAYNNAKSFSYLGMKGYLATITSQEEDKLLQNISMAGAWSGGTRILSNGDSGNLLSDPTNVALTYRVKDMSDLQGLYSCSKKRCFLLGMWS